VNWRDLESSPDLGFLLLVTAIVARSHPFRVHHSRQDNRSECRDDSGNFQKSGTCHSKPPQLFHDLNEVGPVAVQV
jgi:hypothetical protein